MTQLSMVKKLASLVKDDLDGKDLILSTEQTLVDFLEDDTSEDGILELKPAAKYHRHLLHRLADIYGFEHESVGEGENRHLVLECCDETSIPSVLVSDILAKYDKASGFDEVEKLASLVKDNLYSKQLILSTEKTLVKFLEDNTSEDGILKLQPTDKYNRHLLHRLADIYGFAHESFGEGENRHLVLECCYETAIPSVLVSDILDRYDESSQNILTKKKEESDASGEDGIAPAAAGGV